MTTPQSSTAEIRKKLNMAFDDTALTAFCFDYFPSVYDSFTQGMRKDDKITLLLAHCRRQPTGFATLLENLRQEYGYAKGVESASNFPREELKPVIDALEAYLKPSVESPEKKKPGGGGEDDTHRPQVTRFLYHGPLPPNSRLFRGRKRELNTVKALCRGEVSAYLIIFGGRQTGKTSLFYRMHHIFAEKYLICQINLEAFRGAEPEKVYRYIASELGAVVKLPIPSAPRLDSVELSQFVLQAARQIHHDKLLLLFDELGSLPQDTKEALASLLRSWFTDRFMPGKQAFGRVMVVLAGGIELYDLAAVKVSPLYNICQKLYLPNLTAPEAIELTSDVLTAQAISPDLSNQLSQAIFDLVDGHPYLTQRIGGAIEEQLKRELLHPDDIANLAYDVLIDCPLMQHLKHALNKLQLWETVPDLLSGTIKFSRQDEEMAKLELVGVAIERERRWTVRNALFEQVLREWELED